MRGRCQRALVPSVPEPAETNLRSPITPAGPAHTSTPTRTAERVPAACPNGWRGTVPDGYQRSAGGASLRENAGQDANGTEPSKLVIRVRFPSPAPPLRRSAGCTQFGK